MDPARISEVIRAWLASERCKSAANRTVSEQLFSREDVNHMLTWIRNAVNPELLSSWMRESGRDQKKPVQLLFIHAGNIPLVGFQDIIAALMSGHQYAGKLSRKDPYLADSLLSSLKAEFELKSWKWSSSLDDLNIQRAEAVLFSGSVRSAENVRLELMRKKIADHNTRFLIRTAGFSIAFIDKWDPSIHKALSEAIYRFGGSGCRSVKYVVLDNSIWDQRKEIVNELLNSEHEFGLEKRDTMSCYLLAAMEACGWDLSFGDFWAFIFDFDQAIPQQSTALLSGGIDQVMALKERFGPQIQSFYSSSGTPVSALNLEALNTAQEPLLNWKADGVDALKWLKSL